MVGLLLGMVGTIAGALDLSRLERDRAAPVWFLGGAVLTLFVPFGGHVMLAAVFPLHRWVSARKLERSPAALAEKPAPPQLSDRK